MLDRYVGWVETFRETHLAFVRGAAGGDPWVAEVYEETRDRLVDVALEALDLPDDARAGSWCWPGSRSPRTWSASGPGSRRCPAPSCSPCSATSWTASPPADGPSAPRTARASPDGPQPARDVGARSAASSGGGCSWATTSGALAPVESIDFFTVAP